ncbi:MAG: hypothetical protein K2N43_06805 [Lachnospiraceae bacterium]|nr:hypothetical protein [Lachnospiraceae bacterium]
MRIGLYGLPGAGKTTILSRIDFAQVFAVSQLLHEMDPSFSYRSKGEKDAARRQLALALREKDDFLMDGHYAFGDKMVFTEEDGALYDVFLYLYINPDILAARMEHSEKNRRYLAHDIAGWQRMELEGLRAYCHRHNKDFYVLDNPPGNTFDDVTEPVAFIRAIWEGYSCVQFARACVDMILATDNGTTVILTDGDRTLTEEDSSSTVFQYTTHIFDGNFYTGYQTWRQKKDFCAVDIPSETTLPVHFSGAVLDRLSRPAYILTSGHPEIWIQLARQLGFPCFSGSAMSADAKFFITKFLQDEGKKVLAYGDSMNDYYMLRQADQGYLVQRRDGNISCSLNGRDLGGIRFV